VAAPYSTHLGGRWSFDYPQTEVPTLRCYKACRPYHCAPPSTPKDLLLLHREVGHGIHFDRSEDDHIFYRIRVLDELQERILSKVRTVTIEILVEVAELHCRQGRIVGVGTCSIPAGQSLTMQLADLCVTTKRFKAHDLPLKSLARHNFCFSCASPSESFTYDSAIGVDGLLANIRQIRLDHRRLLRFVFWPVVFNRYYSPMDPLSDHDTVRSTLLHELNTGDAGRLP